MMIEPIDARSDKKFLLERISQADEIHRQRVGQTTRRPWQRTVIKWIGSISWGVCCCSGCARMEPPVAPVALPPSNPSPQPGPPKLEGKHLFTLRGVVQAVTPADGEVTIAHEAMPGFMEAMVMPFLLRDKKMLEDVQPGDVVEGTMTAEFRNGSIKDYELTDLKVTGSGNNPAAAAVAGPTRPAILAQGEVVPDFTMTTQTGATLRLADLRGKVVALTFIYTRCPLPDFCPAVDAKFAELNRRITLVPDRAEQVALVSVSFDPEHDTPAVLARHAQLRGAKPPWMFAVAAATELAKVGPALGLDYFPERDQFGHNLTTAVIDADGHLARLELGRKWTPAELSRTILSLLPAKSRP